MLQVNFEVYSSTNLNIRVWRLNLRVWYMTACTIRTIFVVKELFDVGIEQDDVVFISKKGAGRSQRLTPKTGTHSWSDANSENV